MRVLLVDDEKELVTTLAERMAFRGITVDWATSGEDALKLAADNQYDVAVLDVKMPGIDGFELKTQIQQIKPHIRFIFLTGHGSEVSYQMVKAQTDPEYYLVKPVDIKVLLEKIHDVIDCKGGVTSTTSRE